MRITVKAVTLGVIGLAFGSLPAHADIDTTYVKNIAKVPGLSDTQVAAAKAMHGPKKVKGPRPGQARLAANTARAYLYRGSPVMWIRDSVDFGFNGKRVTWSSGFQERGYVFPNMARNLGIARYENAKTYDRWRSQDEWAVGLVTPWGDVKAWAERHTFKFVVNSDGYWYAWE